MVQGKQPKKPATAAPAEAKAAKKPTKAEEAQKSEEQQNWFQQLATKLKKATSSHSQQQTPDKTAQKAKSKPSVGNRKKKLTTTNSQHSSKQSSSNSKQRIPPAISIASGATKSRPPSQVPGGKKVVPVKGKHGKSKSEQRSLGSASAVKRVSPVKEKLKLSKNSAGFKTDFPLSGESKKNRGMGKKKLAKGTRGLQPKKGQMDGSTSPSEGSVDTTIIENPKLSVAPRSKSHGKSLPLYIQPTSLPKLPCPKEITRSNEKQIVRAFLDTNLPHMAPFYGTNTKKLPKGMEFLKSVEFLQLELRKVYLHSRSHAGICYKMFSQYNLKNEKKDNLLMSFGFESTTRLQVLCCAESRSFQINFYDFNAAKIFRAAHSCSLVSTFTRYFLCCVCGSNACGNGMSVFDNLDRRIGRIQQCNCCTKRLMAYMESGVHMNAKKIIPAHYTCCQFFGDRRYKTAGLLKFNVLDARNNAFVRIEQHLQDSTLCKFIYLQTLEPVGYVRRSGDAFLQIDLWRHFRETEKVLLIAASILLDHLIVGISVEGSFLDLEIPGDEEEIFRFPPDRTPIYEFFCYNRLRTIILITIGILVLIAIIVIIAYSI